MKIIYSLVMTVYISLLMTVYIVSLLLSPTEVDLLVEVKKLLDISSVLLFFLKKKLSIFLIVYFISFFYI